MLSVKRLKILRPSLVFCNTNIETINSGKKCLCVHGIIRYNSIFGKLHWSTYCAYMTHLEDMGRNTPCKEHNDTDNDEP